MADLTDKQLRVAEEMDNSIKGMLPEMLKKAEAGVPTNEPSEKAAAILLLKSYLGNSPQDNYREVLELREESKSGNPLSPDNQARVDLLNRAEKNVEIASAIGSAMGQVGIGVAGVVASTVASTLPLGKEVATLGAILNKSVQDYSEAIGLAADGANAQRGGFSGPPRTPGKNGLQ